MHATLHVALGRAALGFVWRAASWLGPLHVPREPAVCAYGRAGAGS